MNKIPTYKNSISIIPDAQLKTILDNEVVPYLTTIQKAGYLSLDTSDQQLYYECYLPTDATRAVVISHGFCESIEKYKEVIFYFAKMGYQVYLVDHRGHGRSHRDTTHPNMVHINHFTDYTDALHCFISNVVKLYSGNLPLYLYAHSMGGCIGALYLEIYPDTFKKAILTSPMLAVDMGPIPAVCVRALGWIMVKLHKQENYAPGQHAFISGEKCENSGSACPERFHYYQDKKEVTSLFQNCGSSYGWAYESFTACHKITKKRNCKKITVPVLVFQSLNDNLIKASGIHRFVKNTPSAKLIQISGSRHEIYNSTASVLEGYYHKIFEFFSL